MKHEFSPAVEKPPSLGAQLVHHYLLKKDMASNDVEDESMSKETHKSLLRLIDRVRTVYSENNTRKNLRSLPETKILIDLVRPSAQLVLKNLDAQKLTAVDYEKVYSDLVRVVTDRIDSYLEQTSEEKAA